MSGWRVFKKPLDDAKQGLRESREMMEKLSLVVSTDRGGGWTLQNPVGRVFIWVVAVWTTETKGKFDGVAPDCTSNFTSIASM
jgi:hypothetical protein